MMMYGEDDEYGLGDFLFDSVKDAAPQHETRSAQTHVTTTLHSTESSRGGAATWSQQHSVTSPPPSPGWSYKATAPVPMQLSSTETRPMTQPVDGKRVAASSALNVFTESRPNSRSNSRQCTGPARPRSREPSDVSRPTPSYALDASPMDFGGYLMSELETSGCASMDGSSRGTVNTASTSNMYQAYMLPRALGESSAHTDAEVLYPKTVPLKGIVTVTGPSKARPAATLLGPRHGDKNLSSFFSRSAAEAAHGARGEDDSHDDGSTVDDASVEKHKVKSLVSPTDYGLGESQSRAADGPGVSVVGDVSLFGSDDDDVNSDDSDSEDPDYFSQRGAGRQKKTTTNARHAKGAASQSPPQSAPRRQHREGHKAPVSSSEPTSLDNSHNNNRNDNGRGTGTTALFSPVTPSTLSRGQANLINPAVVCGGTFFARRNVPGGLLSNSQSADYSGRNSALDTSVGPTSELSTDDVSRSGREAVPRRAGGHHSVVEDVQLMSLLNLKGRTGGGGGHGVLSPSEEELEEDDDDDDDEDDDDEDEDDDSGEGVTASVEQVLSRRSDTPPRVRTAPCRPDRDAPHHRIARPAPDRRVAQYKVNGAALPPVNATPSGLSGDAATVSHGHRSHPTAPAQPTAAVREVPNGQALNNNAMVRRARIGSAGAQMPTLQPHVLGMLDSTNGQMWGMNNNNSAAMNCPSPAAARAAAAMRYGMVPNAAITPMMHPFSPNRAGHPCTPQQCVVPTARHRSSTVYTNNSSNNRNNSNSSPIPPRGPASPVMRAQARSPSLVNSSVGRSSNAHSVASSLVSSVPSLHSSDRVEAVADLRQFIHRDGNVELGSPAVEDLDVLLDTTPPSTTSRPSAVAPPSLFTHIGDGWFTQVRADIRWVPSPRLTPDSRPLR